MENVSAEMEHFFEACEILLHDMYPRDFSDKECNLLEHYSLELYVRFGSRRSQVANGHASGKDASTPSEAPHRSP